MKPRKRIAPISARNRASRAAYRRDVRRVIEKARWLGLVCPVCFWIKRKRVFVEENHHIRGKHCEALRHDKRGWLLVSREGHDWIERNRAKAQAWGWLAPLGKWNVCFTPDEPPCCGSVAALIAVGVLTEPGQCVTT